MQKAAAVAVAAVKVYPSSFASFALCLFPNGQKAAAMSVTKKVGKSDTLKLAYDLKSEAAAIEYSHKPIKLVLGTSVSKSKFGVAKPTLSVVFENTYTF